MPPDGLGRARKYILGFTINRNSVHGGKVSKLHKNYVMDTLSNGHLRVEASFGLRTNLSSDAFGSGRQPQTGGRQAPKSGRQAQENGRQAQENVRQTARTGIASDTCKMLNRTVIPIYQSALTPRARRLFCIHLLASRRGLLFSMQHVRRRML